MTRVLWALGAGVLLLALVLALKVRRDRAEARAAYAFDVSLADRIERLKVAYAEDSVTLVKAEGRWVTLPDSFAVDSARVAAALRRLVRLEDRERVSVASDAGRLAEYGLDPQGAKRVEWTTSAGRTERVLIGNTSGADFSSTYWMRGERQGVFRTPGNFTHEIAARADLWRDRRLFPGLDPSAVRGLEVGWIDAKGNRVRYVVERAGASSFRLAAPRESGIPAATGEALLLHASNLLVDEFLPEVPGFDLGMDTLAFALRLTLRDGGTRVLAAEAGMDGFHYARHPAGGALVKIGERRLDPLRRTPEELLAPPPEPGEDEVETIFPEEPGFPGN